MSIWDISFATRETINWCISFESPRWGDSNRWHNVYLNRKLKKNCNKFTPNFLNHLEPWYIMTVKFKYANMPFSLNREKSDTANTKCFTDYIDILPQRRPALSFGLKWLRTTVMFKIENIHFHARKDLICACCDIIGCNFCNVIFFL